MNIPLVDLKAQYLSIKKEIDSAIQGVIDQTAFIGGQASEQFEADFAEFCGAKHAVGVSNGTSALRLALQVLGVGKGDEVIVPANTFIATAEVATMLGATVRFVDVSPLTSNMEPGLVRKAVTPRTKLIIPVHLYGQPADMAPIMEIAEKRNVAVLEDCAQAHGATYRKKRVPVSGIGCFSFYPGKNLGAYGDAGAIVTNDAGQAELLSSLANHGRQKGQKYLHDRIGSNERLDNLQAAILGVKLKHLPEWTRLRQKHAATYSKLLSGSSVSIPGIASYATHAFHLYVIQSDNRDALLEHLHSRGIGAGIHYPVPLHLQPAYKSLGLGKGSFPEAERQAARILSLPMFPELKDEQIKYVVDAVKDFRP